MDELEIGKFAMKVLRSSDVGILISKDETHCRAISEGLTNDGYVACDSWIDAVNILSSHSVAIQLRYSPTESEQIFDLISQYRARQGAINIVDSTSLQELIADFDSNESALILVITTDEYLHLSASYPSIIDLPITMRI